MTRAIWIKMQESSGNVEDDILLCC
eukprot:COSAG02_NODE_46045_length_352_cov_0.758893_1_plen_24_part_01